MIELDVNIPIESTEDPIDLSLRKYRIPPSAVHTAVIFHRALDARANRPAVYAYQIRMELENESRWLKRMKAHARIVQPWIYQLPSSGERRLTCRPVVIGFGPCGMAAALLLARCGYNPLVLERGPAVEKRKQAVEDYWHTGILNPEQNVQFGEGGAGAFSDGKLTTRVKDPRAGVILNQLIEAGADPSIAWLNHPHIGTDSFLEIDRNIRKTIESLGGEIRFETKAERFLVHDGKLQAILTDKGEEIPCEAAVLAVGHSARDTFLSLHETGLFMKPKKFAVGFRAEHLQSFIDARQYRNIRDSRSLPPSEYHLAYTTSLNKGVYSFCMCPGGYVVASASTPETTVTNGMSYHARDGRNANAAILVQVDEKDYGTDLFSGMHFQESLEHQAFVLGKGKAPCETIAHYLGKSSVNLPDEVQPTYPLGVEMTSLVTLLSDPLNQCIAEMLEHTETIFPGFTGNGALLTGIETRTSAPIRMERSPKTLESSISGLYPSGEGAGYAGGIVSSAIDGMRTAEQIISLYQPI